jgi:hypothetical protein
MKRFGWVWFGRVASDQPIEPDPRSISPTLQEGPEPTDCFDRQAFTTKNRFLSVSIVTDNQAIAWVEAIASPSLHPPTGFPSVTGAIPLAAHANTGRHLLAG